MAPEAIVNLPTGALRGAVVGDVYTFKGVPYAAPIAGAARWRAPAPRAAWTGVRDARAYAIGAPQFGAGGSGARLPWPRGRRPFLDLISATEACEPGEDCLVVNIWSPTLDPDARLPVLVYFHGGGLRSGSAHGYDCSRIAQKGVVAVGVQYRLGPFGFLHASHLFEPGVCADNRGFLDQIAALQWVKENIAAFGGDPTKVTISGESAGAQSVYILTASPQAKGLFQRAIAMGGNTYAWAPVEEYHLLAADALKDVGVAPGDARALASMSSSKAIALQQALAKRAFQDGKRKRYGSLGATKLNFLGAAAGTDFLPQPPPDCYAEGAADRVDLLLGACRDEGSLFSIIFPPFRSVSAQLAAAQLAAFAPGRDFKALFAHYRAQMRDAPAWRVHEQINTDAFFLAPTIAAAEAHAAGQPGRTFHYQVDCAGSIPGMGAMHGLDIALVMGLGALKRFYSDDPATQLLSDTMLEAWTNFVKTGRPAAADLPEWPPYERSKRLTMVLDHNSRVVGDIDGPLLQYWRAAPLAPASAAPPQLVTMTGCEPTPR